MKVVIIGGGASAMMAAITAAEHGDEVTVIEKNHKLGKKLLATGNGRCNLTNANYTPSGFFCDKGDFADVAVENFTPEDTVRFFKRAGVWTRIEDQGRVYPYSGQAAAVRDGLARKISELSVRCLLGKSALHTYKTEKGFVIEVSDNPPLCGTQSENGAVKRKVKPDNTDAKSDSKQTLFADKLIIATGGMAGEQYGSTGDGYKLASSFGHTVTRPLPALAQLMSNDPAMAIAKGVRAKAAVRLYIKGELAAEDIGEIQFTGRGISGICTFNVSRTAARALEQGCKCKAEIDFMPETDCRELACILKAHQENVSQVKIGDFLDGFINKKLAEIILRKSGIKKHSVRPCAELVAAELKKIVSVLKGMKISIDGVASWKDAQTTCGGVLLCEVDPQTMGSKLVSGLYFCGEILDVDGMCGGYNLQWAWSSGYLAGKKR